MLTESLVCMFKVPVGCSSKTRFDSKEVVPIGALGSTYSLSICQQQTIILSFTRLLKTFLPTVSLTRNSDAFFGSTTPAVMTAAV